MTTLNPNTTPATPDDRLVLAGPGVVLAGVVVTVLLAIASAAVIL